MGLHFLSKPVMCVDCVEFELGGGIFSLLESVEIELNNTIENLWI